ncbi:MAG: Rpn family recombination-promoting nuclease/putative transposase [Bacteroidales bacterium]|nr:Rpn family recombination-promoting nuclease/putative transposase [Bacteroidales bacterium]
MNRKLAPAQMRKFVAIVNEVERYRDLSEKEKEQLVLSILDHPYMDLRCDWAFKHVMENTDILKMLLNDFLPEEIDSVQLLPNEIDKMRPDDKNVIMDILCHSVDGKEFIVEMQRRKRTSFKNRMLYYGASMLHSQLKPREPYSALKSVYVICFMDFKMQHETDQLVYRYALCEQNSGERYNDLLSVYFCELPRLKATGIEGLDPVQSWFYILANMRIFAGKPEDMGKRYAAIAEEARMPGPPEEEELIKYFRNMITEEERLDMGAAYYEDGFNDGLEKGKAEGKEEGKAEAKTEMAKSMLKEGMDPSFISKVTGLFPAEILKLKEKE